MPKVGKPQRYLSGAEGRITAKQQKYGELLATGLESVEAAKQAGFSPSFARAAKHRLSKLPAVAAVIEGIQKKGREMAAYGLAEALVQAQESIDFARLHKNPMAAVKGCELKAKLSGLLIERIEVAHVDLSGSLSRAAKRVIEINPALKPLLQAEAEADQRLGDGFAYTGPGRKDDPLNDD